MTQQPTRPYELSLTPASHRTCGIHEQPHGETIMTRQKLTRRTGVVSVLAVILLAVFSGISVAMVAMTNSSVQQSANHARIQSARFQADSGLGICMRNIAQARISPNSSQQQMLDELAAQVASIFQPLIGSQSVMYDGQTITIPQATLGGDGRYFTATIQMPDADKIRIRVTGHEGAVSRRVTMDCHLKAVRSRIFDFGLACNSRISIKGEILDAAELLGADILSATYSDDHAVMLGSKTVIEGEIHISNPNGYATWGNHVTVAGTTHNIADHIHPGIGPVHFPRPDISEWEQMNLNVLPQQYPQGTTFENIRIPANTKTTFAAHTTINGVLFIEAPNDIHFAGNCTINGVVITQDAKDTGSSSSLKFSGNVHTNGVDGTFLLAPGFDVTMSGNASGINGCMAAESFKLSGNAGGTIIGTMINYGDDLFEMTGNSKLTIRRTPKGHLPKGFYHAAMFVPDIDTYSEL